MFCAECGKEIPSDSVFCPECGSKQDLNLVITPIKTHSASTSDYVENGLMTVKNCGNCGCIIPVDSRFCPECNAPQNNVEQNTENWTTSKLAVNNLSPDKLAKIAMRNKMIAGIYIGALVLCLVIGLASAFIKPTINLNNYITVSFEGYDTVGKAVMKFNVEKFQNDYEKKLSRKKNKKSSGLFDYDSSEDYYESLFNSYYSDSASSNFLSSCVSGSLDMDSGLSNGDVITYTWVCDDEYARDAYGYNLKYKNIEYTVLELKEAESFDPFEGIEIVFEGISPYGTASIYGDPTDEAAQALSYQLNKDNNLENGDTVVVTVTMYYSDDPIEYCISNYGKIPSSTEKTFTVEGLDSYIRTISEISDECMQEMQNQAENIYQTNILQNWGDDEKLNSFKYIGSYLLTNKGNEDYWDSYDNILYLVYKAQVNNKYSNDGETYDETNDIYWYIAYQNLFVDSSGSTTLDITNYWIPDERFIIDSGISSGWWDTKSWYYYGYQTLDELYNAVVTANIEYYNHEDGVDNIIADINEEEKKSISKSGFYFANSSEELLSQSDIEELSDEDLRYAINELYARHGYIFDDDDMREFYEQFEWYNEEVKPDDFSLEMFNDIEKENLEMLQKERDSRS